MDHSRGRNIALRRAGARPSASRQPPSRVVAAKLETAGCGTRAVETHFCPFWRNSHAADCSQSARGARRSRARKQPRSHQVGGTS